MAKKQIIFRLDENVHKQLQIYAIENETSVQKLMEDYVIKLLANQKTNTEIEKLDN